MSALLAIDRADIELSVAVSQCPACYSANFSEVSDWASAFEGDVGDRRVHHPRYKILECSVCGLYYKSHRLSNESINEYYALLDAMPFDLPYLFPTDKKALDKLEKLKAGSRILDFGCSTGRLLAALKGDYERVGIELNADAVTIAESRGIKIIPEHLLYDGQIEPFDAVVLTDVFEHLITPTEMLSVIVKNLRPGGTIILVTGYADAVRHRAWMGEYWYFRLHGHLQMLSKKHIEWLCEELELNLVQSEICCHYAYSSIKYCMQRLQEFSYIALNKMKKSMLTNAFKYMPVIKRAEHWVNLPATDTKKDHVIAVLEKLR